MTDLFDAPAEFPESVLLSIYNAYPRKTGRPAALKSINKALWRICGGEIDGQPRTQAEAIDFLRIKTEEARRQMYGRLSARIPHMTTWLNQSRYLRPELKDCELPAQMSACIEILAEYPNQPPADAIGSDPASFALHLCAIDKALEYMERSQPGLRRENHERRLKARTQLYAMAVSDWPVSDMQYVPSPRRFFDEHRFEQDPAIWRRKLVNGYDQERAQAQRLVQ